MKSSRRALLALCSALVVLCQGARALAAAEVLDVSIGPLADPRYSVAPRIVQPAAQTFTVVHSGKLSRVDLQMSLSPATVTEPLLVQIVRLTPGGAPDDGSPALASVSVAATTFPELAFDPDQPYVSIPLGASSPTVTTGDRLAVLLTTTQPYPFLGAPTYVWATSHQTSVYGGGGFWYVNTLSGLWETDFADAMTRGVGDRARAEHRDALGDCTSRRQPSPALMSARRAVTRFQSPRRRGE